MKLRRDGLIVLLGLLLVLLTVAAGHVMPLNLFPRPGTSSAGGPAQGPSSGQGGLTSHGGDFRPASLGVMGWRSSPWGGGTTARPVSAGGRSPAVLGGSDRPVGNVDNRRLGTPALADRRAVQRLSEGRATLPSFSLPGLFPGLPGGGETSGNPGGSVPIDDPGLIFLPPWGYPLEPEEPAAGGPQDGAAPQPGEDDPYGSDLVAGPGVAAPAPGDQGLRLWLSSGRDDDDEDMVAPIPIPGSLLLFGSGLGGVVLVRSMRRR